MRKVMYVVFLFVSGIILCSCKRDKKDFIGPELAIASKNFQVIAPFAINYNTIAFTTDSNWFNATFNERVSWTIKVVGQQSKAEKIIKGTSDIINRQNSLWTGGHSGLYFFQSGEQIISELTVFGTNQIWYDTSSIVTEKSDYGTNVIIWWDMDQLGVAKHNVDCYWFDYYDGDSTVPTVGTGERRLPVFQNTTQTDAQPLQGVYRSMDGVELSKPVNYYIGGCSHTVAAAVDHGFNTSLDNVYLNFYLRRRTATSSIGVTLLSISTSDTASLSYDTGTITWTGWQLVSIKLSDMKKDTKYSGTFDPAHIRQFGGNLQTYTNTNVETGFDIDFITITKGAPFNPDNY